MVSYLKTVRITKKTYQKFNSHVSVTDYFGPELTEESTLILTVTNATTAKDKLLSDLMMTMWTNFAKSG